MNDIGARKSFFDTTRGHIVLHLMDEPQTVSELARKLDLTDNAVRAHLVALERDGVVVQEGERRSGGRPAYVYQVTPEADELLPGAYDRALVEMIDLLENRLGGGEVEELLAEAGRRSVGGPDPEMDPDARVERALDALTDLGGYAEAHKDEDGTLRILTKSCPLSAAVREHPGVARFAQGVLEAILGVEVEMRCEIDGRPRCVFEASLPEAVVA